MLQYKVGVMQGRLLPKYQGRYQAFPLGYWKQEFEIASSLGLNSIEFILDYNDAVANPLMSENGILEIGELVKATGVQVKTVCADYFMAAPLHSIDANVVRDSLSVLEQLVTLSAPLGITDIVIPCVDQSSLGSSFAVDRFVNNVRPLLSSFRQFGVNMSLEADLAPSEFCTLLSRFDSPNVTVNYDIGNSASLGFDPVEELEAYGDKISDIHIKDRIFGGGPVELGTGAADFDRFFHKLMDYNYLGPFIMQAYRDEQGVEIFKKQLDWISAVMQRYEI